MRLVAAMHQGFCGIPISKFEGDEENDFELNLVENYLIKLHYNKDSFQKNRQDFGILL